MAIWDLLNVNFNEENGYRVDYSICAIYDSYAVVRKEEDGTFERVYYTKNDENDTVELGNRERCFIIDVTETEYKTLQTIQTINGGTYEKADEVYTKVEELEESAKAYTAEKENFEQKIVELDNTVATLTVERDEANAKVEEVNGQLDTEKATTATLQEEVEGLRNFKKAAIEEKKNAIIASYTNLLSQEVLDEYASKTSDYEDEIALDRELAYVLKNTNSAIFTKNQKPEENYIPKDNGSEGGLEAILSKYKK